MTVTVRRGQIQDAAAISRIHVDTWRNAYRGILPYKILDGMNYGRSESMWDARLSDDEDPTTVFVAEAETGNLMGFAACGPSREKQGFEGEIYAIYVSPMSQRMGLGRKLVLAVVRDLRLRGYESMIVWVLAENSSKRFFEELWGEVVLRKEIEMAGKKMQEEGYGWRSLSALTVKLEEFMRNMP